MVTEDRKQAFEFKQFTIQQDQCTMKVGTDGVLLGAWAETHGAKRILDIGTGTGVIAVMMAQREPEAVIDGIEIDEVACVQASENMQQSPWADRLSCIHCSLQDFTRSTRATYDLIVSNPPFFSGGTFSENQDRNSVRHTIKLPSGDLLSSARNLLAKEGKFCVILPYLEGLRFVELAANYKLFCTKMVEVFPTKDKPIERLLLQFEHLERSLETSSMIIQHEERNNYTDDYMALTRDFYLKM